MKLKNKNTGEIVEITMPITDGYGWSIKADSLVELCEEWSDYEEEPKSSALDLMILTLTDFIENEPDEDKIDLEDCKQMLGKLKAWTRLKDKGLKFKGISGYDEIHFWFPNPDDMFENSDTRKDLDLLFCDDKSSKEQTFHRADIEFGGEK